MATVLIRDLPEEAKDLLRQQAQTNGRSMEGEARHILLTAVQPGSKRRKLGALASAFPSIGEPLDGWGPLSEEDLAIWEGDDQPNPS